MHLGTRSMSETAKKLYAFSLLAVQKAAVASLSSMHLHIAGFSVNMTGAQTAVMIGARREVWGHSQEEWPQCKQ